MNPDLISTISKEVYRRFPEVSGVRPKVQRQPTTQAKSVTGPSNYLLTFHLQANPANHQPLPRWVRVVVNEQGKILKVTTSR